jgi:hypothetical protein
MFANSTPPASRSGFRHDLNLLAVAGGTPRLMLHDLILTVKNFYQTVEVNFVSH